MSLTDREHQELAELLDAVVDRDLSDAQRQRLTEILSASETAREMYVRSLGLSASLLEYAVEAPIAVRTTQMPTAESQRNSRRWWVFGVIATTAAVILVAVVLHGFGDADADAEANELAAQITGLADCIWADAALAPVLGDALTHGQQLNLQSGTVEITFDSGAQVTLEGPARLDLNSAWEATLHHGKLRGSAG